MPTTEDIRAVAPALEKYAKDVVRGDLWQRPGLSLHLCYRDAADQVFLFLLVFGANGKGIQQSQ